MTLNPAHFGAILLLTLLAGCGDEGTKTAIQATGDDSGGETRTYATSTDGYEEEPDDRETRDSQIDRMRIEEGIRSRLR